MPGGTKNVIWGQEAFDQTIITNWCVSVNSDAFYPVFPFRKSPKDCCIFRPFLLTRLWLCYLCVSTEDMALHLIHWVHPVCHGAQMEPPEHHFILSQSPWRRRGKWSPKLLKPSDLRGSEDYKSLDDSSLLRWCVLKVCGAKKGL